MNIRRLLLLSTTLASVLVACGRPEGDDDDDGSPTPEPTPASVFATIESGFTLRFEVAWMPTNADADIHLVNRIEGGALNDALYDCSYSNMRPNWGRGVWDSNLPAQGDNLYTRDDPWHHGDVGPNPATSQGGPEVIEYPTPFQHAELSTLFEVWGILYHDGDGDENITTPVELTFRLYLNSALHVSFAQTITDDVQDDHTTQAWHVLDIDTFARLAVPVLTLNTYERTQ
ncbi:MAG TPA: hypothetical protein VEA38_25820 [Terriglobales bacterium]|nr:hypothetical protein [Terriglobales bacterium]